MKYTFQEDSPSLEKCVQICPNLSFCPICVARNMTSQQPPFSKNDYIFFFVCFHIGSEGDVQPIGLKKNKTSGFSKIRREDKLSIG